jgi:hypothetical protein
MTADELRAELRRLLAMEDGSCSQRKYILAEIMKLVGSVD